ncbi:MAG: hypothetical protein ABEL76_15425 [Bradymonadaceae bacterium]
MLELLTVASTALVLVLGVPATASAGSPGWGSNQNVDTEDLIPRMDSAEAYNERYTLKSKLDNGGLIVAKFTISNVGFFNGGAKVKIKVEWPNRPTYRYSKKFGSNGWSFSKNRFELKAGDTRFLARDEKTFVVHHSGQQNGKKIDLKFVLNNDIAMWSPGSGEIQTGEGYYALDFISLRSDASGQFEVGETTHEIQGSDQGYGEHGVTNIAPFRLADHIANGRVYHEDPSVFYLWRKVKLADGYGGVPVTFIVVGYKGEIIFADADADIKFGRVRKDPKTEYKVPHAVQINGRDGEDSVKLVLRSNDVSRRNLLESYGKVVQTFASAFTEPYHYSFDAKWGLEMDIQGVEATVRGEGGYMVDFF